MTPAGALVVALAAAVESSPQDLTPGKGREIVVTACTGCHTAEIIAASRMSRRNWETTLIWMEDTQGMAPLEPSVRKAILDYLEATQGLGSDEGSGETSPWASPRYRPNPIW